MNQTLLSRVPNPKRKGSSLSKTNPFRYYAGFSSDFAEECLSILKDDKPNLRVLDPWNGSGTTTSACAKLGISAAGSDLNPVANILSVARLAQSNDVDTVISKISALSLENFCLESQDEEDPLHQWFSDSAVGLIRAVEKDLLLDPAEVRERFKISGTLSVPELQLAAVVYVTLFGAIRSVAKLPQTTNPTWMRASVADSKKVDIDSSEFLEMIRSAADNLKAVAPRKSLPRKSHIEIVKANCQNLPFEDTSFAVVFGSPPYCTRLDYAVATRMELAILGCDPGSEFKELRRDLIGTTAVGAFSEGPPELGVKARALVDRIQSHPSKSSGSYYYKTYSSYFVAMTRSIEELSKKLKNDGYGFFVVQNSYYKEILVNLADLITEMAEMSNLHLESAKDFEVERTLRQIHASRSRYGRRELPTETVMVFKNNLS